MIAKEQKILKEYFKPVGLSGTCGNLFFGLFFTLGSEKRLMLGLDISARAC
jgi:hypothetical protein